MIKSIITTSLILCSLSLYAQDAYVFTEVNSNAATPVISQGNTGTCWSFSTSSFLESEIIRLTGKQIDLSEMYNVRNTYLLKADNYIMRQGKAQFSEGGLAHDVINSAALFGIVPQAVFSGLKNNQPKHNHSEMSAVLTGMLDVYIDKPSGQISDQWKNVISAVMDQYLGEVSIEFTYEGKKYTSMSFMKMTKIEPANYVSLTSFSHAPFHSSFILNIPDNFSNGSFYNLPLDQFINTIDNALANGFTVELDCDVSEKTFSARAGIAVIPADPANNKEAMKGIYPETVVDQDFRQSEFENQNTTDDHLMHITGSYTDQNGTKYYKVKNSWGNIATDFGSEGHVYFSEAFMRLKAISVTVHKDAIPTKIASKLGM